VSDFDLHVAIGSLPNSAKRTSWPGDSPCPLLQHAPCQFLTQDVYGNSLCDDWRIRSLHMSHSAQPTPSTPSVSSLRRNIAQRQRRESSKRTERPNSFPFTHESKHRWFVAHLSSSVAIDILRLLQYRSPGIHTLILSLPSHSNK
jgi:hypothetical protein